MTPARPLAGVQVLDLSRVLSGPSCGKALVDLGASVIKVEPPEGDLTRTARPRVGGIPVYFAQQNCGKQCISVDLRAEAGRELVAALAAKVDVVLENFRPGVLERLGLGYATVRGRNPAIVYCSITGYGQAGVMAGRRAYAPVMHAELGLMEFTARKLHTDPRAEAVSHADLYAGLQATVGILAALLQRDRTGVGQHIDVSMAEVMLQATEWTAVELAGGPGDQLHVFGSFNAPVLRLADGTVVHVPGDPVSSFPAWCVAMQRADLLDDERFRTRESRHANRAAMLGLFQEFASTFTILFDFEAALAERRPRGRSNAADREGGGGRVGARTRGIRRRRQRTGRSAEASPLAVSFLRRRRRHDRTARVAGRTQPRGACAMLDLSDHEIDRLHRDGVLVERPV